MILYLITQFLCQLLTLSKMILNLVAKIKMA